jgi:hypothetical protein
MIRAIILRLPPHLGHSIGRPSLHRVEQSPSHKLSRPIASPRSTVTRACTFQPSERLRGTTAMPMEGTIEADALVAAINQQMGTLASCAALIQRTDPGEGSLNVRVDVDGRGSVRFALQSPVNDDGKPCLRDGFALCRVRDAGQGRAMVLLGIAGR